MWIYLLGHFHFKMELSTQTQGKYVILAVCGNNKGRSASYHAHMNHILDERGIGYIRVDSAGFNEEKINDFLRQNDTGANHWIREVMNREGIHEIEDHEIKPVNERLVTDAYVVLTFETHIRDGLRKTYPESSEHIYTMREYLGWGISEDSLDVDDAFKPKNGLLYRGRIDPRTLKAFSKVSSESKRLAERTLDKVLEEIQHETK